MPRHLPPVDDEVFEALQRLAEPLVDDVNSVLRRLLGMDSSAVASALPAAATWVQPAEKTAMMTPRAKKTAKSHAGRPKTKKTSSRPRAKRGSLLPEREYEEPLLGALIARGGSAPASQLIEEVGAALDSRLTQGDREVLDSGLTRWRNRVQFVRLKLVQAGQVKNDSPRGIWEITPVGRARFESLRGSE